MDSDQSDSDNQSDSAEQLIANGMVQIPDESSDIIIRHFNVASSSRGPPQNYMFDPEPERDYEVAGENSIQFDTDLPPEHSYLGNLDRVSGIECLKPGRFYQRMPIFAHHSLVFPGEQIPMILSPSVFDTTNFLSDSNEGCLFGLMFLRLKGVPKNRTYGVTCQIYEKGTDGHGNIVFKSRACQRFVIYHKLKENENFAIYYMMNPHRCTATVQILPEIVLGDPLLSSSSNNMKKFFTNKSITTKIRRFETGTMAWPLFVYDQYSISGIAERAKAFLSKVKVDSMSSDPVALSFWLGKNVLPNEEDRLNIFVSNSVTDRMQIIGKSMNVIRFFKCKQCLRKLANFNTSFAMSKQGVQSSYCNPSGFIHETNTVYSTLHNAVYVTGGPSVEFSWFPGYSWQIALCSNCHHHLGWKFMAVNDSLVPKSFFGLSGSCIVIEKDDEPLSSHFVGFANVLEVLNYGGFGMNDSSDDDEIAN